MNSTEHFFTGLIGLFLFACLITLAIYWIVFPIFVLQRMKELCAAQREIAKALQWMVNNWKH